MWRRGPVPLDSFECAIVDRSSFDASSVGAHPRQESVEFKLQFHLHTLDQGEPHLDLYPAGRLASHQSVQAPLDQQ